MSGLVVVCGVWLFKQRGAAASEQGFLLHRRRQRLLDRNRPRSLRKVVVTATLILD